MNLSCFFSVSSLFLASVAVAACSSSTTPSTTTPPVGAAGSGAGPTGSACEVFGGSCVEGSSTNPSPACPEGTVPVVEGDGCRGTFAVCCVAARKAGTEDISGDLGLLCTDNGFAGFAAGRCDEGQAPGESCGVGCECRAAGGSSLCDCSRGLPATKAGTVECAVFGCGTITCAVGCTCADPKVGACTCP